ncbi:MAG TPA: NusG domain II-containing protein [Tissierellaceae bacterium]|nr:NusG domain II-containing protein [Tissierellaceae bacterium]
MTKGDKGLVVFVVVLTLLSLIYIKKQAFSNDDRYVSIQVDGEEIKQIIFDKKLEGNKIPIETEFGYNLVELGDGEVRVIEASCPDQIDVKQGYISKIGETIVCLPNKLVIEIKGMDGDNDIDMISQ